MSTLYWLPMMLEAAADTGLTAQICRRDENYFMTGVIGRS
jgi:hypothetical protein